MATGKVTKRGKSWLITITMGYIDGKQQRKRWTSKRTTKAEATDEMNEALHNINRRAHAGGAVNNDYRLSDLFKMWREYIDTSIVNPITREDYKRYIERVTIFLPPNINVYDLSPQLMDKTLADMTQQYSNNSINKSLARLKSMLNYGVERSIISSNPIKVVKALPKKQVYFKRALTVEEANALIDSAPDKWPVLWRFILSTGMRKEEVIQLTWKNIDFKNKAVRVLPTDKWKPKSETSIRTIPLVDKVIKDLESLEKTSEYVFVTKKGTQLKNNMLRELRNHMKKAFCVMRKLPHGKRLNNKEREIYSKHAEWIEDNLKMINVHALRYTFCTHLIGSGVDLKTVQRLMGHSNPEITLKIYAQYCHGNAEAAMEKLPW